jgi:protein ImuB
VSPERAPPRVLALVVPELSLQRVLRSRPPAGALAVIAEGAVRHATPGALAAGVRPGDSLVQARAACAALEAVPLDAAADRAALRALAETLLSLSPAVEVAPPDAVLLDASGMRLAGREPAAAELALAGAVRSICGEMGWQGRVALADGKAVALALARHGGPERTRAAPGEGARELAPLPIEALGLPAEVARWLAAVGVGSVGALAMLPPGSLAQRFGAAGAAAARLARGEDLRPLVPFRPETFPREHWDLEGEVGVLSSAEPVIFAAKRLADRVAARLAGRGMGASRLRLTLLLDPRGEERVDLPLARPGADAAAWMIPLRERLSGLRLPAPVRALDLAVVEAAEVPAEQLAVGDRPEVARALDVALSRIAARLGEESLFAAEAADRHRPEAAYRPAPFRRSAPPRDAAAGDPGVPPGRPTRLVDPPLPVVALGDGGRLTALRVDGAVRGVLALSGPERIAGEWWGDPFDRDYWRIRLDGLGETWIYRDGRDGRLWLHGLFD